MGRDIESLKSRMTTPYTIEDGSNNVKLLQTFVDGYWEQIDTNLDDLRTQSFPSQMTAGSLDNYARTFGILRKVGEGDAALRIRIQGEIKRRIGGTTANSILEFVESFLGATAGDVKIFENVDASGNDQHGFYRIQFSDELLSNLGFAAPYTDEISDIEDILNRVSAAGVRVQVELLTGAEWDAVAYDDPDAIYGT